MIMLNQRSLKKGNNMEIKPIGEIMKFVRVCESRYGGRSCIYHYINLNQIVEFHISTTDNEICIEATLTNGMRVILGDNEIQELLSETECKKLKEQIDEECERLKRIKGI